MKKTIKLYLLISLFLASNFSFAGDTHIVKMLNMSDEGSMVFEPAFIKINAGDSITFEMTDAGHNAATVYGPAGSVPFDTKYKPSTTIKFDVSGLYLYKCSPHAMMAMAGIITVAEVEELVPAGELDPNQIHTPGIFVQRIIQGEKYEKRIEQRTVRTKQ